MYLRESDPLMYRAAFLAQMVERWPFKPMVVGSIPTEGAFFVFGLALFVCIKYPIFSFTICTTVVRTRLPNLGCLDVCGWMFKGCGCAGLWS